MFTLKLYRAKAPETDKGTAKIIAVHHVVAHDIGGAGHPKSALELVAFMSSHPDDREVYYVGTPEERMEGFGRDDLHLDTNAGSWWSWAVLENWEGNTSETYRPASVR